MKQDKNWGHPLVRRERNSKVALTVSGWGMLPALGCSEEVSVKGISFSFAPSPDTPPFYQQHQQAKKSSSSTGLFCIVVESASLQKRLAYEVQCLHIVVFFLGGQHPL